MPLGASWDGEGTTFALFSAHADAVELCLFDGAGGEERRPLAARTGLVWHGYLPGVGPGQRYGYRVSGPFVPDEGLLFNPAKLLIDPYARAIDGRRPPRRRPHVRGRLRQRPARPTARTMRRASPRAS